MENSRSSFFDDLRQNNANKKNETRKPVLDAKDRQIEDLRAIIKKLEEALRDARSQILKTPVSLPACHEKLEDNTDIWRKK